MPTYEYQCALCGKISEEVYPISNFPPIIECHQCRGAAKRVLSSVAVHCDSAPWIDDTLRGCLQKDGEKPIETRSELNSYCKSHDIIPTG